MTVLTTFLLVAAPQALGSATRVELETRLGELSPATRDLVADATGNAVIGAGRTDRLPNELAEVFGATDAALETVRGEVGPHLRPRLGAPDYVAVSTPFAAPVPPTTQAESITSVRFAADPLWTERVRIAEGRLPERIPDPPPPSFDDGGLIFHLPELELVLSASAAERMQWPLGEERWVAGYMARLVGVFEAVDPAARYWQHTASILEPTIIDDGNAAARTIGTAYLHPLAASRLHIPVYDWRLTAWFPFDTAGMDAATASALAPELRRLTGTPHVLPASAIGNGAQQLVFDSAAADTIENVLGGSVASTALLAIAGSGPLAVVLIVLALSAGTVALARRPTLTLATARGASPAALRGAFALEGAVMGVPAAALGAVLALVLVPGEPTAIALGGAALVGLAPAVAFALRAVPSVRRSEREDLSGRSSGPARVVLELLAVGFAVLSSALLLFRGPTTDDGALDPLAIATPVALAVVTAVALRRVLPVVLHSRLRRLARGRSATGFIGLARAIREPVPPVAAVAVVVAVSVAVFSNVMVSTVSTGVRDAVFDELGADVRVEGPIADPDALDGLRGATGVADVVAVDLTGTARLESGSGRGVDLLLADIEALENIQPRLGAGAGPVDDTDPVPFIASPGLAEDLIEGGASEFVLEGEDAVMATAAPGPMGLGAGDWVIVDRTAADRLGAGAYSPRLTLIDLHAGASSGPVLGRIPDLLGATARATTAEGAIADALASPMLAALRAGFLVAAGVAVVLAGASIALMSTLATARRRHLANILELLGADRRERAGVVLAESAPPAIGALVAGAAIGFVLPVLVLAGADFTALTGGERQPGMAVDPPGLTILGATLIALTAASLAPSLVPLLRRSRRGPR